MGSSSYLVSRVLWAYVMLVSVNAAESRILLDKEECHLDDLKGLKDFKASIKSDTSGRLETWTGERCCIWDGVSCDNKTGRVNKLYLPGFITSGDAPDQTYMEGWLSPSITLMVSLEVIDLSALSHLTGQIPPLIGFHLPKLRELTLFGNKLSGSLPESIGKLSNLEELYLHENSFSRSLPSSLGSLKSLRRLYLHTNQFSVLGGARSFKQFAIRNDSIFHIIIVSAEGYPQPSDFSPLFKEFPYQIINSKGLFLIVWEL